MLGSFRKHYKKWLIGIAVLVIPTFIMWQGYTTTSRGRPGEDEVAKVNGVPISEADLRVHLSQMQRQLQQAMGDSYDPDMIESSALVQRALNGLIGRVVVLQESERLGIKVSQEAIEARLKNLPDFKKDGKFSPEEYNRFIAQRGFNWGDLYESLRAQIRDERLLGDVEDSAKLSETELRQEYQLRNEKVKVKYLALKPAQFESEVKVTEEALKDFYANNQPNYIVPETVVVKYVVTRIVPTDSDRQAVRKRAEGILAQAKTDKTDFIMLAKRYSEAPNVSETGGDMGWLQESVLPPALAAAVSRLKEGELSDVVDAEQAMYIIKCEGRRVEDGKKMVKLRQILLRVGASAETRERIASQIDALVKEADDAKSLETAAKKLGLEVKESRPLSKNERFIQDVGLDSPAFVRTAFGLKEPGEISRAIITPRAYYVLELARKIDAHVRDFAEVKDSINTEMVRQEALKIAHKKVEELAGQIKSLDELAAVDKTLAAAVKVSEPVTRTGFIPDVAGDRAFLEAAFCAELGKISAPILGTNGAYLLEVVEKIPFDEKQFAETKDSFRDQVIRLKKAMLLDDWQKWLQAKADIRLNEQLIRQITGE